MKSAFITSLKDLASENFKNCIIEKLGFEEKIESKEIIKYIIKKDIFLYVLKESELLFAENLHEKVEADFLIFLSKHKSLSGINGFYVHSIGNFSEDISHGGRAKTLSYTSALLSKRIFMELTREVEMSPRKDIRVGIEVTHHGPFVKDKVCIFVEIGSDEKMWRDKQLADMALEAILKALQKKDEYKIAIGIGGPHYAPKFIRYQAEEEYAIGHIMPDYAIEKADFEVKMVDEMVSKTLEPVEIALIDWKGIKSEYRKIILNRLKEIGINFLKI